jgi:ATP-binding cassette subfamily B protein RaxB
MEEVNTSFTGIALEFTRTTEFVPQTAAPRLQLTELFGNAKGMRAGLGQILALSVAIQLVALLTPLYTQIVVDEILPAKDYSLLTIMALGFAFIALLQFGIGWLRGLVTLHLSSQLAAQISTNLFAHMLRLSVAFFSGRQIGDVLSRFNSLDRIRETITNSVIESLVDGLLAIGMLLVMLAYSPTLTMISVFAFAAYCVLRLWLFDRQRKATDRQLSEGARRDSTFMETIRALSSIKTFQKEAQRLSIWQNQMVGALNASIGYSRTVLQSSQGRQIIFSLQRVALVLVAAREVIDGQFTAGMLMAFIGYADQFNSASAGLMDKWQDLRMIGLHLERVSDIALEEPETLAPWEGDGSRDVKGSLEFRDLCFSYAQKPLIASLNLAIAPGESIAITGSTGCGKSTLLRLIAGLEQPSSGEILIDGLETSQHPWLRKYIGSVMQGDQLISGTIGDNISFFDDEYDLGRIREAAALAKIDAEIYAMPMGYDTAISEFSTSLSGGQVQRVLLARAFYRKPRILILDEATSSLDVGIEAVISDAIKRMSITRIIVAHRLETVLTASRYFALSSGNLIEIPREAITGMQDAGSGPTTLNGASHAAAPALSNGMRASTESIL